jgi:hypothetical protein
MMDSNCCFCGGRLRDAKCDSCQDYQAEIAALDGYKQPPQTPQKAIAPRHIIGGKAHVAR